MILQEIAAKRKAAIEELRCFHPLESLEKQARENDDRRNFREALRSDGINVIAEFKKASPSRGAIRKDADPREIAAIYSRSGAAAVSCLTEPLYFQGKDEYVPMIREACPLPVLRKDFTVDVYQIYEAAAIGADAVLLIVHLLSPAQLREMMDVCSSLGLTALVEVHNEEELTVALDCNADVIGINNRDLTTLDIDLNTSFRLLPLIPDACTTVVESGVMHPEQVRRLVRAGARNFLVGSSLMAETDIEAKYRELFGFYKGESVCPS